MKKIAVVAALMFLGACNHADQGDQSAMLNSTDFENKQYPNPYHKGDTEDGDHYAEGLCADQLGQGHLDFSIMRDDNHVDYEGGSKFYVRITTRDADSKSIIFSGSCEVDTEAGKVLSFHSDS